MSYISDSNSACNNSQLFNQCKRYADTGIDASNNNNNHSNSEGISSISGSSMAQTACISSSTGKEAYETVGGEDALLHAESDTQDINNPDVM